MLGDGGGPNGAAGADERRKVARGRDDDRASQALLAERTANEVAHLAPALSNERDDDHVGLRVFAEHAEKRALADAGTREEPDALTATERQERVDRAHARLEGPVDRTPREGRRRRGVQGCGGGEIGKRTTVERLAEGVDHAPEEPVADRHRARLWTDADPRSWDDAGRRSEGGRQEASLTKTDDFQHQTRLSRPNFELRADRRGQAHDFDEHADDLLHLPLGTRTRRSAHARDVRGEVHAQRRGCAARLGRRRACERRARAPVVLGTRPEVGGAQDSPSPRALETAPRRALALAAIVPSGVLTSMAPGPSCAST